MKYFYPSTFFGYYKIGRFIFSSALLLSFQMAGLLENVENLASILIVYTVVAVIRLIAAENINCFDFLLDIIFISAIVYVSFNIHSYLTLFYLFPIFFSSILMQNKRVFVLPIFSAILYATIHQLAGNIGEKESIMNISLHFISFIIISIAGHNLKRKMQTQEKYIQQLEDEKIKMQGYERLYRVSADLAHELRNPLASISAAVQFLKEGRNNKDFINMLDSETKRLISLINDFLIFARPSDAPVEDVDLSEMLKVLIAHQDTSKKIILDVHPVIISANKTFIEVAINNILRNAVEAANFVVKVSLKDYEEKITVEIEDDGSGISDDIKDKLFEPFVTTKVYGTGLGLAIAHRMITELGGKIIVNSSPSLKGARFTIVFPKTKVKSKADKEMESV